MRRCCGSQIRAPNGRASRVEWVMRDGCGWCWPSFPVIWIRTVRAKAVSSLRFATAVQDASRGLTHEEEATLAGGGTLQRVADPRSVCAGRFRGRCCNLAVMAFSIAYPLKTRL